MPLPAVLRHRLADLLCMPTTAQEPLASLNHVLVVETSNNPVGQKLGTRKQDPACSMSSASPTHQPPVSETFLLPAINTESNTALLPRQGTLEMRGSRPERCASKNCSDTLSTCRGGADAGTLADSKETRREEVQRHVEHLQGVGLGLGVGRPSSGCTHRGTRRCGCGLSVHAGRQVATTLGNAVHRSYCLRHTQCISTFADVIPDPPSYTPTPTDC